MKAVEISRFGGPEVLEVVDRDVPRPGPGQVLVRVRAAGVNFADTLMRQNRYALTPALPSILGHEVTGTVEELGAGVQGLRAGSRVAAPLFAGGSYFGGYAEYALIDARFATTLPDAVSFETGVALMVQGLTALHLTRQASPSGKTVLVNAAAGGVGSLLVQLVRRAGAKTIVAAAGSERKASLARALGADVGVVYTQPDWTARVRGVTGGRGPDLVYESAGGAVTVESLVMLAPLGQIVIYGALNIQSFSLGVPELLGLIFRNQSVRGFALAHLLDERSLRADLLELFDMAAAGRLRVLVDRVLPLEEAADAHRALEGRGTAGKIVLAA